MYVNVHQKLITAYHVQVSELHIIEKTSKPQRITLRYNVKKRIISIVISTFVCDRLYKQ